MAYRVHKEETPQLRIKTVKSNQQTALTREMEKPWLLPRAQHTLQVNAMWTKTSFPQAGQKIIQHGSHKAALPLNPQKQRNGGKEKRRGFDFMGQLAYYYQGAQTKLP